MALKPRKKVSSSLKIEALQRHLVKKEPVSGICEELAVQPSAFYMWQRELFARGATLFENPKGRRKIDRSGERICSLEEKLKRKDEVISELLEEHVTLKKSLGVK